MIVIRMTKKQYKKYAEQRSGKSPMFKNMLNAFWIGGLICVVGQIFLNLYMNMGMDKEIASTLSSVTLIFISATLTGLNIYDKIAKIAGAGTLVPITGFANAVVSPAIEFKNEGYITGVAANIFKIAGPVITYGIVASVVSGIIYLLV